MKPIEIKECFLVLDGHTHTQCEHNNLRINVYATRFESFFLEKRCRLTPSTIFESTKAYGKRVNRIWYQRIYAAIADAEDIRMGPMQRKYSKRATEDERLVDR